MRLRLGNVVAFAALSILFVFVVVGVALARWLVGEGHAGEGHARESFETLVLIAYFVVIAFMAAAYLAAGFARPLDLLVRHMERVGRGAFQERITLSAVAEIEQVALAANRMSEALAEREGLLVHHERLASLGTLVAGVAHEINNPLTFLRGNEEMLVLELEERLARELPDEERAFCESALEAARANLRGFDQLARLATGLRVVGRAPKGERVAVDVGELLNGCLVLAHARFSRGVEVEQCLGASQTIVCEPSELSQVFLNLFLNATDAMPDGGRLVVSTEDAGSRVLVRVCDTGSGIPESIRPRLFKTFATSKSNGTGLGLALSKRIVEAHGGTIGYETGPEGTTFTVTLPASAVKPTPAPAVPTRD